MQCGSRLAGEGCLDGEKGLKYDRESEGDLFMESKLKEFWNSYKGKYFFLIVAAFIIHGSRVNTTAIGIDTESMLWLGRSFYDGWLQTGRQGLFLVKWLAGCIEIHPYFAQMTTMLLCATAAFCWLYVWERLKGGKEESGWFPWIIGGLLFISHPVLAEEFYFILLSSEYFLGMIMVAGALALIGSCGENRRKRMLRLILSTAISCWAFCIYQSFESVFILGCVSILFVQGLEKMRSGKQVTAGEFLGPIPRYILVFCAAFVINMVITKLFFGSSTYLQDMVFWGRTTPQEILYNIMAHVVKALTGARSVYYHFSFGLLYLLCLIHTIMVLLRRKPGKGSVWAVLFLQAALFAAPFLMAVLLGCAPPMRSQMVMPIMICFLGWLMNFYPRVEKPAGHHMKLEYCGYGICALVCIIGIFAQSKTTLDLYYTDQCRYEQDVELGTRLMERLDEVIGNESYTVAVIGKKSFIANNATVRGEAFGLSFFEHDAEMEPLYYHSTGRVLGFLHTLGGNYQRASEAEVEEARRYSANMPDWPAQGSVAVHNGVVVVRLGEPDE